jgi:hypothetical protein
MALLTVAPALGQSGDSKTSDPQRKTGQAADPGKDRQRQIDEFSEAERVVPGGAGMPECVWVGRRIVTLMWRDDLETAFRHLDLYGRFGCPGGHIQEAFRCLVRNGNIDPKVPESLNKSVHACWVDPTIKPSAAAPARPNNAASAAGSGQNR